MRKIALSLVLLSLLALPTVGLAQWGWGWGNDVAEAPTLDVMQVLNRIVNWLFSILLVVAAIFIIVAAYHFVTAAGDPEKTKRARDFVLYALIGVMVAFLARGLVVLVERVVGA